LLDRRKKKKRKTHSGINSKDLQNKKNLMTKNLKSRNMIIYLKKKLSLAINQILIQNKNLQMKMKNRT
jgi:ribosomal protein S15P/S13E